MSVRIRVCRHPADLSAFELFDLPHCLGTCSICPVSRRLKMDRRYHEKYSPHAPTAEAPAIGLSLLQVVDKRADEEQPVPIQLVSTSGSHRLASRSPR